MLPLDLVELVPAAACDGAELEGAAAWEGKGAELEGAALEEDSFMLDFLSLTSFKFFLSTHLLKELGYP